MAVDFPFSTRPSNSSSTLYYVYVLYPIVKLNINVLTVITKKLNNNNIKKAIEQYNNVPTEHNVVFTNYLRLIYYMCGIPNLVPVYSIAAAHYYDVTHYKNTIIFFYLQHTTEYYCVHPNARTYVRWGINILYQQFLFAGCGRKSINGDRPYCRNTSVIYRNYRNADPIFKTFYSNKELLLI